MFLAEAQSSLVQAFALPLLSISGLYCLKTASRLFNWTQIAFLALKEPAREETPSRPSPPEEEREKFRAPFGSWSRMEALYPGG